MSAAKPGWRFRVGVALFAVGMGCPLFVPLVIALDLPAAWTTALTGALLVGGPEVLCVAAVAVMGREGFDYVKERALHLFKRHAMPARVSRTRYRIGLVLFCGPFVLGWIVSYWPALLPGYEANRTVFNMVADVVWVSSLFVLGGEFWDKLQALFLYRAKATLPET